MSVQTGFQFDVLRSNSSRWSRNSTNLLIVRVFLLEPYPMKGLLLAGSLGLGSCGALADVWGSGAVWGIRFHAPETLESGVRSEG